MKPFPAGSDVWPDGPERWHLYVLPDYSLQPLSDWIRDARRVVADALPDGHKHAIELVKPQYVHATLHQISIPAQDVADALLARLIEGVAECCAQLPEFAVEAGRPSATDSGVILRMEESEQWRLLTAQTGDVIRSVFGPAGSAYMPPPAPHLSIGYCVEETSSEPIQAAFDRQLRSRPAADFPVAAVHLLRVHQDPVAHTYEWGDVGAARISLGQPLGR